MTAEWWVGRNTAVVYSAVKIRDKPCIYAPEALK